ncbi:dihydrodipicolinate synthase family protein [Occultella glacieicola]|uniref:Dihydrodipicolinate synthase family protein n=1 Tax=Occultella glacieicola TaxID=2518684 RepID=A0ABY2E4L8_9MICO|nr:dihydrodipicolinate synthase family protein [Occultella glacieicola]TDE92783.1 dihydrodipicolinate synthase family protein [Occultella glacieicola]
MQSRAVNTPDPDRGPLAWLSGVVAAPLTPFDAKGRLRSEEFADYAVHLVRAGVSGLAVGAHTGRGGLLAPQAHADLIRVARATGVPVVATVCLPDGARPGSRTEVERVLLERADAAPAAGASAVLCVPPPAALDPDPAWVARLHELIAEATGLPVLAFLLYEAAAGNVRYGTDHLAALSGVPGVTGVKIATLDDAVAAQDAIIWLRRNAPRLAVLTGEDRMFGPSLMWGATGALVGIAAARAHLSVDLLRAWQEHRLADFVAASDRLDAFARLTFTAPLHGYVQRLAWAAAHEGIMPPGLAHDPGATPDVLAEREVFLAGLAGPGDVAPVAAAPSW